MQYSEHAASNGTSSKQETPNNVNNKPKTNEQRLEMSFAN